MRIYLDTNVWNILCDEGIEPRQLLKALTDGGRELALSAHALYELTKAFRASPGRGCKLLSYLKDFVDANIPCCKDNMELLAAEMWALQLRTSSVDAFLSERDYPLLKQEVDRLARGDQLGEHATKFITERHHFAAVTRESQSQHLQKRPDTKSSLKAIAPGELQDWLQRETFGPVGVRLLTNHIMGRFPEAPAAEAREYASALLRSPLGRLSRTLVRSDLYYNWRCARRNSNPKDLIDDMYHVLNASHCDVYATAEERQREYAALLLPAGTSVAIYDPAVSVCRWIEELA